jgi:hypothetical protein
MLLGVVYVLVPFDFVDLMIGRSASDITILWFLGDYGVPVRTGIFTSMRVRSDVQPK